MFLRLGKARQGIYSSIKYSFGFKNLIGDPFVIATLSISLAAFIISLVTSLQLNNFPGLCWWGLALQFLILILTGLFYLYDIIDYYRIFLTAMTSIVFIYNTNTCAWVIYSDSNSSVLAAAGFIILSVINLLWILYYGSDNASPINRWIDSLSMKGIRISVVESSIASTQKIKLSADKQSSSAPARNVPQELQSQNYMYSSALNGFENTDPRFASKPASGDIPQALPKSDELTDNYGINTCITDTTSVHNSTIMSDTLGNELENFSHTAKALYSYQADASDAYEISFEQDEILRVSNITGRWWKAKKANGETGIIPSNYIQLTE